MASRLLRRLMGIMGNVHTMNDMEVIVRQYGPAPFQPQ